MENDKIFIEKNASFYTRNGGRKKDGVMYVFLSSQGWTYSDYIDYIINLYTNELLSANQIVGRLNAIGYNISSRAIQRTLKRLGIIRSSSEAYRLANSQNRIFRPKKAIKTNNIRKRLSDKTRYRILERDKFRCVRCGARASDGAMLEIDHIKGLEALGLDNNNDNNLQVLCYQCNSGKYQNERATKK